MTAPRPPVVTFSAVNIRKFVVRANRLSELVELGTLTLQAAAFLDACVVAGLNIVVAGGTQAGKTTMLNTLGSAVPGRERIVSAEEVYELRFDHPDWAAMQTRQSGLEGTGEIKLRHLVKEALRMRPSRIVGRTDKGLRKFRPPVTPIVLLPGSDAETMRARSTAAGLWSRMAETLSQSVGLVAAQQGTLVDYCVVRARIEQGSGRCRVKASWSLVAAPTVAVSAIRGRRSSTTTGRISGAGR